MEKITVGAYLELNQTEFWNELEKQEGYSNKFDIVFKFGDETKEFTKEELAKLLF